ncbi:MAG: hypothetical protein J7L51_02630 [Desulfurococcales archaeon]|nr:hypothetical protein [Desulfurococcales archaeon]
MENIQTEKYGTFAEDIMCDKCNGVGCEACNYTGRISGVVNPEKEANEYKKERETGDD